MTRKRTDLLTDYVVNMILLLEKIVQNTLGFIERTSLMGEICMLSFAEAIDY
ncbi:MAG TPA: hypothetical protein VIE89_10435 [Candidatus Binatia bacterium]